MSRYSNTIFLYGYEKEPQSFPEHMIPELAAELCFAALSVYREIGSKKFWTSKITIREQKIYDS
jgi:hypothetical protein